MAEDALRYSIIQINGIQVTENKLSNEMADENDDSSSLKIK